MTTTRILLFFLLLGFVHRLSTVPQVLVEGAPETVLGMNEQSQINIHLH
jgi:hypothetical protein